MVNNFITQFPTGYTPTEQQIILIQKIEAAFNSGKKFVVCNAPTGSGKSMLAKTLANNSKPATEDFKKMIMSYEAFEQDYLGGYVNDMECLAEGSHGAIALTITKALQDQYQTIFSDTLTIKGKTNYQCDVDPSFDVETAPCFYTPKLKHDCQAVNRCHYYNARNAGLCAQFAALNYKMFQALPEHVKRRDFIICDEASELEEELVKQFSAEVTYTKLKHAGIEYTPLYSDDLSEVRAWVTDIRDAAKGSVEALQSKMQKNRGLLTVADRNRLSFVKHLHNALTKVDDSWTSCEYIVDRTGTGVVLTPLRVNKLADSIFSCGEKVLLMSATIVDHKNFTKTLGITDYEYIEAPSTFDAAKSPIFVSTRYRLNYSNLKQLLPAICKDIKAICDKHGAEKGVVHTHSQEICDYMFNYLTGDRFLFRKGKEKNEHILKEHSETQEPTVLVSPSLTHGVDLKDELARFQIIIKLPYSPLSNKRIKRLFDSDKDWYQDKMLSTLVQTAGRATRTKDDHSVTYILDGNIVDILQRSKDKLPKHFLERFT